MKSKKEHKILFGPGGCITKEAIEAYIDGLLPEGDMKKLKAHARRCQLCSDSLEGAAMFKSGHAFSIRVNQLNHSRFRRGLDQDGKTRKLFYGITSAAASIALVFGIVYILKYQDLLKGPEKLAENAQKVEEVFPVEEKTAKVEVSEGVAETEIQTVSKEKSTKSHKEKVLSAPAVPKVNVDIADHEVVLDEQIEYEDVEVDSELDLLRYEPAEEKVEEKGKAMLLPAENKEKEMLQAADKGASGFVSSAMKRSSPKNAKKAFYVAEVKPMFKGGDVDGFSRFVADSLKVILPDTVLMQSVVVGFMIDTSGNLRNVKLISGTDSEMLNNQIIDIIKNSPQWVPASISGKPISSEQEVQVVFGN